MVNALVTRGTLKTGDYVICGRYYGKVRSMHNDLGKNLREALPSMPVKIYGIQGVPNAADKFYVVENEKVARRISEQKVMEERERELSSKMSSHLTLESLHDRMQNGEVAQVKLIVKADVQGSVEVLTQSLEKLSTDKVKVDIVHAGVGGINESDVMLAMVSDAVIIGFHVKAGQAAQKQIEQEGIDARYYTIIYEAIEDVKTAMEGKLKPTYKEVIMGSCEVREVFKASKIGSIAGCFVLKGKIARSHKIRVIRNDVVVYEGTLGSLKRFKDDMREVKEGYDCGLTVKNLIVIKAGDIV